MPDFWTWYYDVLAADDVPMWARSIEAAREIYAASSPPKPVEPPKPPRIPGCRVTRSGDFETISVPRRGPRMIHGVASTETISSNGNAYSMKGCKVVMPVPLLSGHHQHGRIGECVLIRKEPQRIYVQCVLDDDRAADYAWQMIQDGRLRGLSVGTTPLSRCVVEGVHFYDRWQLREVSLVKTPGNPDCFAEMFDWCRP